MWMLMSTEFAVSSDIGLATHSAVRWLCVGVCLEVIANLRCYLHGVLYTPHWCSGNMTDSKPVDMSSILI